MVKTVSLKSTSAQPQRHELAQLDTKTPVAIVILAAGKAGRMGEGGKHKLLAEFDGVPLVRRSALSALGSNATFVLVVTGHRKSEIEAALDGLPLTFVHNLDYASGMASSLKRGFSSARIRGADGILVMLADMPNLSKEHLDALICAFRKAGGETIVRATSSGKPGNPVILPSSLDHAILRLEGEVGARGVIATAGLPLHDVGIGNAACLDVDTTGDIVAAGGVIKS